MSVIVGLVCRALRIAKPLETEIQDSAPDTQQEDVIAPEASSATNSSVMAASGHTGHTVVKVDFWSMATNVAPEASHSFRNVYHLLLFPCVLRSNTRMTKCIKSSA